MLRSPLAVVWSGLAAIVLFILGIFGIFIIQNGSSVNPTLLQEQSKVESQTLNINITDQNKASKKYAYDFNLMNTNSLEQIFATLDATSNDFGITYSSNGDIATLNGYTAKSNEFWFIKVNGSDTTKQVQEILVNQGDTVEIALSVKANN